MKRTEKKISGTACTGYRTRVSAVTGQRPSPLDEQARLSTATPATVDLVFDVITANTSKTRKEKIYPMKVVLLGFEPRAVRL